MNYFKIYVKHYFRYIFTIDKDIKLNGGVPLTRKKHIWYRICIVLLMLPILYVLLFGYIREAFTVWNVIRTIMFIIFFRIIAKDATDVIFVTFFNKESYKLTSREIRKIKLRKIRKSRYGKLGT